MFFEKKIRKNISGVGKEINSQIIATCKIDYLLLLFVHMMPFIRAVVYCDMSVHISPVR